MWDQEKEVIVETVREMNLKSGCRNDEIKVGAERKRVMRLIIPEGEEPL